MPDTHLKIKSSSAVDNTIDEIQDEIQILPFGKHITPKGEFVLTEAGVNLMIADFNASNNEMVIDYEHQTLKGSEAPAAGWITGLSNKGTEGLWAQVRWTERAMDYIDSGEYRYLSPVFIKRAGDNSVVRLVNAALTNQPAIDGMRPLGEKSGHKEDVMDETFLKLLGLEADAPQEEATKKLKALIESHNNEIDPKLLSSLNLNDDATISEVMGSIEALKQGHEQAQGLAKRIAELEQKLGAMESTELVAMAMKEGKIAPAQKGWAEQYAKEDASGFRAFIAKATVVVPLTQTPQHNRVSKAIMDETQKEVNNIMGITDEMFKKHNN